MRSIGSMNGNGVVSGGGVFIEQRCCIRRGGWDGVGPSYRYRKALESGSVLRIEVQIYNIAASIVTNMYQMFLRGFQ